MFPGTTNSMELKAGDRLVWIEEGVREASLFKGIVEQAIGLAGKDANFVIQWYENGIRGRKIRYHISQIQDEPRIQRDIEHYRDIRLKEILSHKE